LKLRLIEHLNFLALVYKLCYVRAFLLGRNWFLNADSKWLSQSCDIRIVFGEQPWWRQRVEGLIIEVLLDRLQSIS
jgi:hypothetical protein